MVKAAGEGMRCCRQAIVGVREALVSHFGVPSTFVQHRFVTSHAHVTSLLWSQARPIVIGDLFPARHNMASGICQSSSLLPCTRRPSRCDNREMVNLCRYQSQCCGLMPTCRQAHGRQIAVRANEPNKTIREFSEKTGKVVNNAGQEAKGAAKQVECRPAANSCYLWCAGQL